jgi:hypothetical protein
MESQVLQTTPRLFTSAAFLCVALSLIVTAPAFAQVSECKNEPEKANAAPLGAKDLIQLQPNAARPTLDIALADKSGGTDKISFLPKAGRRVGVGTRVAAELTDAPRTGSAPLGGDIFVRANGTATARGVWRSQSAWRIFQDSRPAVYLGTITIYGPDFADFNYALAITTKWPWWSAVTIIGVVLVAFAAIALISDFSGSEKKKMTWSYGGGLVIGISIGLVLGALTYFTIYSKNATWGEDPGTQITALAIASFTAATGGFLAGRRLFPPQTQQGGTGN